MQVGSNPFHGSECCTDEDDTCDDQDVIIQKDYDNTIDRAYKKRGHFDEK